MADNPPDPFDDLDSLAVDEAATAAAEARLKRAKVKVSTDRQKRTETGFVKFSLAWVKRLQVPNHLYDGRIPSIPELEEAR